MLNKNQLSSLIYIYKLFENIYDNSMLWYQEIKENDELYIHMEKLLFILNFININITNNNIDDLIILTEEYLKEYLLQNYSKKQENDIPSDSDDEIMVY